jgi:hypothetical protein
MRVRMELDFMTGYDEFLQLTHRLIVFAHQNLGPATLLAQAQQEPDVYEKYQRHPVPGSEVAQGL